MIVSFSKMFLIQTKFSSPNSNRNIEANEGICSALPDQIAIIKCNTLLNLIHSIQLNKNIFGQGLS